MAKKKLTRREFLKLGGVSVVGAVGVLNSKSSMADTAKNTKRRLAMVIDLRRCFGCNACSVACKAQFDVPLGVWRSWVITSEKGKYPDVKRYFLPVLCNHCKDAPCLKGCPATAIIRDENGIIVQKEERCIGCGYCIQNCPYKMRFKHPKKKVANKCNFCVERLEQGLEPSCVNTCNARARIFGDLNDPKSEVSKLIAKNPVQTLLPDEGTEPNIFYIGMEKDTYKKRSDTLKHA